MSRSSGVDSASGAIGIPRGRAGSGVGRGVNDFGWWGVYRVCAEYI